MNKACSTRAPVEVSGRNIKVYLNPPSESLFEKNLCGGTELLAKTGSRSLEYLW